MLGVVYVHCVFGWMVCRPPFRRYVLAAAVIQWSAGANVFEFVCVCLCLCLCLCVPDSQGMASVNGSVVVCSGHGACDGSGSHNGTGNCACLPNWDGGLFCSYCTNFFAGPHCQNCDDGFWCVCLCVCVCYACV